jgi:hypothetical protein
MGGRVALVGAAAVARLAACHGIAEPGVAEPVTQRGGEPGDVGACGVRRTAQRGRGSEHLRGRDLQVDAERDVGNDDADDRDDRHVLGTERCLERAGHARRGSGRVTGRHVDPRGDPPGHRLAVPHRRMSGGQPVQPAQHLLLQSSRPVQVAGEALDGGGDGEGEGPLDE